MLQGRNIKKEELIPIHNVKIRGNIMACTVVQCNSWTMNFRQKYAISVFTLLPWAAARVASLAKTQYFNKYS